MKRLLNIIRIYWKIIFSITFIILVVLSVYIYTNIEKEKHKNLIKQVSLTQLDFYQNKLIPALMGDLKSYLIQDVKCEEINLEGKSQYAIEINSKIIIGDKSFKYPIVILFNNDNPDKPQYVHDTGIEKEIIDYEKEYKKEKEKQDKLKQNVKMSAKDLYYSYKKNEVDADNKYTGKTGVITGKIDSININMGTPNVRLISDNNSYFGVVCYFTQDLSFSNERLSKLKKGQTITISGEIKGLTFVDVTLDNCSF